MASSAKSLSSSAPPSVMVVVVVVVVQVVGTDNRCVRAAGTEILMPESPVQGDARKFSREGEAAPGEEEGEEEVGGL